MQSKYIFNNNYTTKMMSLLRRVHILFPNSTLFFFVATFNRICQECTAFCSTIVIFNIFIV